MSTLSMQAVPSLGHPMEKLLDNYMMAERGGGAGGEEGGGGAAFMLEDGGMISYTGVFMDDEEDSDDDASASSTEAEVMAHLHAALGGSVASTNASGSTSSSSSGSTSTSGGTVSAAPEGESKGEGWKMALLEGLEDFLQVEGALPAGAAGSGGSRRFSFDLSNLDMQTLEQLAAGTTSGPSSRRGSFSLTMLEAEGFMTKAFLPVGSAAPLPSSNSSGGPRSGLPLGNTRIKQEVVAVETASRSSSVSSLSTTASNSSSSSSSSNPVSSSSTATTTCKSKAVKKETPTNNSNSALQATPKLQLKKGTPISTPTGGVSSLKTTTSGLISAASLLPTPQTPHKAFLAPSTPTSSSSNSSSNSSSTATTTSSPNGNGGTLVLPVIPKDGITRIGIYTLEERKARVARFQAKRGRRVWRKKIKYDCRKKLADNRPRVKGRFVRRDEEIDIIVGGAVAAAEAAAAEGVADGGSSALLTQLMDLDELLED